MGILSDFFRGGKSSDLEKYRTGQAQLINQGAAKTSGLVSKGYEAATGRLAPAQEATGGLLDFYRRLIGGSGAEEKTAAIGELGMPVGLQEGLDYYDRVLMNKRAASGLLGSSDAEAAHQRALAPLLRGAYMEDIANIGNLGQLGLGIDERLAGYDIGEAGALGDIEAGRTAGLTGLDQSVYGAKDAQKQRGINNILGLGQLAVSAYTGATADPWAATTNYTPYGRFASIFR